MVSPSALTQPQLRLPHQLREIFARHQRRLQHLDQQCNTFSTHRRLFHDSDNNLIKRRDKPYIWKHVNPQDRVIGKPGKWQRVVSEQLSASSLGRRADVIVLRDVEEEPPSSTEGQSLHDEPSDQLASEVPSAKEIEDAVTRHDEVPEVAEVNASIDALRPPQTVTDEENFEILKKTLLDGYTFSQLSNYLVGSTQESAPGIPARSNDTHSRPSFEDGLYELSTSSWRLGRTPLDNRLLDVTRRKTPKTKAELAEQVLRLVWNITIKSGLEDLGEMELKLQPWQFSFLFDIAPDGRPLCELFIDSALLLKASQILPYRPDRVMRIIGRRQDAEEVARQLKLALLRVGKSELNLNGFRPLLKRVGQTTSTAALIAADDLRYISNLTRCQVVLEETGSLAIYGHNPTDIRRAQRMVLSLLDIPSRRSLDDSSQRGDKFAKVVGRAEKRPCLDVPADTSEFDLHRRYRKLDLSRLTNSLRAVPSENSDPKGKRSGSNAPSQTKRKGHQKNSDKVVLQAEGGDDSVQQIATALAKQLDAAPMPAHIRELYPHHTSSYWREEIRLSDWKADFCLFLKRDPRSKSISRRARRSVHRGDRELVDLAKLQQNQQVIQHRVPGAEHFLFSVEMKEPSKAQNSRIDGQDSNNVRDSRTPYLNAHFVPHPSALLEGAALPRIMLRFKSFAQTGSGVPHELVVDRATIAIDEQHIRVPQPNNSVDIRFRRQVSIISQPNLAGKDEAIRKFWLKLQESVRAAEGTLDAPAELAFRLPHWLVRGRKAKDEAAQEDVEVPYLFEKLEQVQSTIFAAHPDSLHMNDLDVAAAPGVGTFTETPCLEYKEVEGGAICGCQTFLTLCTRCDVESDAESPSLTVPRDQPERETASHRAVHVSRDTAQNTSEEIAQSSQGEESSQAVSESENDVRGVEQDAKHLRDNVPLGATSLDFVDCALRTATLLSRATAGSLRAFGEEQTHRR